MSAHNYGADDDAYLSKDAGIWLENAKGPIRLTPPQAVIRVGRHIAWLNKHVDDLRRRQATPKDRVEVKKWEGYLKQDEAHLRKEENELEAHLREGCPCCRNIVRDGSTWRRSAKKATAWLSKDAAIRRLKKAKRPIRLTPAQAVIETERLVARLRARIPSPSVWHPSRTAAVLRERQALRKDPNVRRWERCVADLTNVHLPEANGELEAHLREGCLCCRRILDDVIKWTALHDAQGHMKRKPVQRRSSRKAQGAQRRSGSRGT